MRPRLLLVERRSLLRPKRTIFLFKFFFLKCWFGSKMLLIDWFQLLLILSMVFSELAEDDDVAQANKLMRHFNVLILCR